MGVLARVALILLFSSSVLGEVEEFFITGPNQLHNVATEAYLVSFWFLVLLE